MTKVDEIRQGITEEQRRILDDIWSHQKRGEKILTRALHHAHGKSTVLSALNALGGTVVWESLDNGKKIYRLTRLGALLTSTGTQADYLLLQYHELLKNKFETAPDFDQIESKEVEAALHLSPEQSRELRELLDLFSLSRGYQTGGERFSWYGGVPDYVDELNEISDLRTFIHDGASRDYKKDTPYTELERTQTLLENPHLSAPPSMMVKTIKLETAFATYSVGRLLGEGGCGRVYEVVDDAEQKFAAKILDPLKANTKRRKRFKNEIRFCERPPHKGILRVLDSGVVQLKDGLAPFYVMPYYKGSLRSGPTN